ncbi:MAG: TonB-dependent receptor [Opitutae bacterium]|nr:TonB-dependent receptor [Opitutae bacterium]
MKTQPLPLACSAIAIRVFVLLGAALSSTLALSAQSRPAVDDETVLLSEFRVSTLADKGYRPGNSVSATRVDTPIKDLPFSISAFTEQFIADIGARDLGDIVNFAPGVTSGAKEFTQGNTRYSIRGFDGAVMPQRNGFLGNAYVDTANVARVEVVKGPASLLYGQITPGGTVNYITKRPGKKAFFEVRQQVGTDQFWRTEVDANAPINAQLAARVVAAYENGGRYFMTGKTQSSMVAPSVVYQVTKNSLLTLDYEFALRNESPFVGMQPNTQIAALSGAPSAANFVNLAARSRQQALSDVGSLNLGFLANPPIARGFNYTNNADFRHSSFESFNGEYSIKLGDQWTVRGNYNWNRYRIDNKVTGLAQWDVTPTAAYRTATLSYFDYLAEYQANPAAVLADTTKTTGVTLSRRKRLQESWAESSAYQIEAAGKLKVGGVTLKPLAGLFLLSTEGFGRTRTAATTFTAWNYFDRNSWDRTGDYDVKSLPVDNGFNRTKSKDTAYYGVLTASFLDDRLIAIAGLRGNRTESDTYNMNLGGVLSNHYQANKPTPQYGLGYKVLKDVLLFASYSESFLVEARSLNRPNPAYNPAIPYDAATNPTAITLPAVPTSGKGYEFGIKTNLLDGRIASTVSLFHLERANRVLSVRQGVDILNPNGTPGTPRQETFTSQATVDQSEGVELETTISVIENWQVYATAAFMDIKTTKFTPPAMRAASDPLVSGNYAAYVAGYNEAIALIKGAVPEGSAERLASLWTRYTFRDGQLKDFWIAGGLVYTAKKAGRTANPTFFFDAYTLIDAAVGHDFKVGKTHCTATINWKNLTDEEYYPANQARGFPSRVSFTFAAKF